MASFLASYALVFSLVHRLIFNTLMETPKQMKPKPNHFKYSNLMYGLFKIKSFTEFWDDVIDDTI